MLQYDLWTWIRLGWSSRLRVSFAGITGIFTFPFLVNIVPSSVLASGLPTSARHLGLVSISYYHRHHYFLEPMYFHDLPTTCEKFYHEIPTMMFIVSFSLLYQQSTFAAETRLYTAESVRRES
jgi:hypothetical protein